MTSEGLGWFKKGVKIGDTSNTVVLKPVAHNLLDNSDFTNVVNQRGKISYDSGSGYSIDRWKCVNGVTITPSTNGVTLQATAGCQWIQELPQDVNARYAGQSFTFAICLANEAVYISKGTIPQTGVLYDSPQVAIGSTGYTMNLYQQTSGYMYPRVFTTTAQSAITLKWAALYIGDYTVDTLPDYVPKGYGAELAECMRYFQKFDIKRIVIMSEPNGGVTISERFPVPMRIAPTITGESVAWRTINGTLTTQSQRLDTSKIEAGGFVGYYATGVASTLMIVEYSFTASADL